VGTRVGACVTQTPRGMSSCTLHKPSPQSRSLIHPCPILHGWQLPPQSMSVSSPFRMESTHDGDVGNGVGINVGRNDGYGVGTIVGVSEGWCVGALLGVTVGRGEGDAEGAFVGVCEGMLVGTYEGASEG